MLDIPNRVKLLLWGNTGAGKTTQIAFLANAGFKVNIMDVDGNLAILNSWLNEEGRKNVYAEPIENRTTKGWERAVALIRGDKWGGLGEIKEWGPESILFVDTGTHLCASCKTYTKEKRGEKDKGDMDVSKNMWSDMADRFEAFVAAVTHPGIRAHVIVAAHSRPVTDELKRTKDMPKFPGNRLLRDLPPMFNCVWHMESDKEGKKKIRTESTREMDLKNSFPRAVGSLEDANLGDLFLKIKG